VKPLTLIIAFIALTISRANAVVIFDFETTSFVPRSPWTGEPLVMQLTLTDETVARGNVLATQSPSPPAVTNDGIVSFSANPGGFVGNANLPFGPDVASPSILTAEIEEDGLGAGRLALFSDSAGILLISQPSGLWGGQVFIKPEGALFTEILLGRWVEHRTGAPQIPEPRWAWVLFPALIILSRFYQRNGRRARSSSG
jgi:hypothetical protein